LSAIGDPFGCARSLSSDLVSGRDRTIEANGLTVAHAIRTGAKLSPGAAPAARSSTPKAGLPGPGAAAEMMPGDVVVGAPARGSPASSALVAVAAHRRVDRVVLAVERGSKQLTLSPRLGAQPSQQTAG
jgi:S1-C subfamily serine protease